MKCACCGIEQVKTGEYEMIVNGKPLGVIPAYNVTFMTYIKGRDICEDCMDKYMYIDALFMDRDIARGGIKYFADGRERGSTVND